MKKQLSIFFQLTLVLAAFISCATDTPMANMNNPEETNAYPADSSDTGKIIVRVGSQQFSATLADNATANSFKARLPLQVSMVELNGNEKYFNLPSNLPSNPSNPGSIKSGDLMLYGNNTLVLFYDAFNTSYSYTRIGRIENAAGLAAALGSGNITVRFELE